MRRPRGDQLKQGRVSWLRRISSHSSPSSSPPRCSAAYRRPSGLIVPTIQKASEPAFRESLRPSHRCSQAGRSHQDRERHRPAAARAARQDRQHAGHAAAGKRDRRGLGSLSSLLGGGTTRCSPTRSTDTPASAMPAPRVSSACCAQWSWACSVQQSSGGRGIAQLLESQKDNIARALPSGFANYLSDTGVLDELPGSVASRAPHRARRTVRKDRMSQLVDARSRRARAAGSRLVPDSRPRIADDRRHHAGHEIQTQMRGPAKTLHGRRARYRQMDAPAGLQQRQQENRRDRRDHPGTGRQGHGRSTSIRNRFSGWAGNAIA